MRNKEYNAAQLEAIRHDKGPAMVLAGPGSGKTAVIVERVRYLIEERKADPSSILIITFTKAAAIEMQYRFMKLTDSSYPEVSFGTFHSVFYQIIRSSSSKNDSKPEIASESFKYEIIRDILSSLKEKGIVGREEYGESLEEIPDIISEISRIKNIGLLPQECLSSITLKHCFKEIYDGYNRSLREFGKIDFDDMIERCYELLRNNKSILEKWQKRFEYLLIDEYQDINSMQNKVVGLLIEKHHNIFAVGDDDQSIYGFRGSDPGIMLKFKETYAKSNPRMINLNINYRCGGEILVNSLKVIDQNTVRFKKDLQASSTNGTGKVIARRYEDRKKQYEAIAYFLGKHMGELQDIAILCRTNSEAKNIAASLKAFGIPSNLENAQESFLVDKGVKLCISYLSFAYKGHKREDFLRIINQPMRYISRDCAEKEIVNEVEVLRFYKGNKRRQEEVSRFFRSINMISHLRPVLAIRYIRQTIGIDKLYPESIKALEEFMEYGAAFQDMKRFLEDLEERSIKEIENKDKSKKTATSGNRVRLLTMHASKGLEFKIVWLPDLNEGIIPSRNATELMQIEEERRMLYVAMTRAKQALILSYVTGNKENPMLPCRVLRPIKPLWDMNYSVDQRSSVSSSGSSSGSSTSSSNSASSRNRSKASATFSYSSSSAI